MFEGQYVRGAMCSRGNVFERQGVRGNKSLRDKVFEVPVDSFTSCLIVGKLIPQIEPSNTRMSNIQNSTQSAAPPI